MLLILHINATEALHKLSLTHSASKPNKSKPNLIATKNVLLIKNEK